MGAGAIRRNGLEDNSTLRQQENSKASKCARSAGASGRGLRRGASAQATRGVRFARRRVASAPALRAAAPADGVASCASFRSVGAVPGRARLRRSSHLTKVALLRRPHTGRAPASRRPSPPPARPGRACAPAGTRTRARCRSHAPAARRGVAAHRPSG
ncbi:hypothetical protein R5R35_008514 [Gryllus longicercus]|uniref:Uncharacterized protein n=1 Tax=Gryllus longicercus TaxID=2509291 RepID=A0AAN9VBT4_9ORTH